MGTNSSKWRTSDLWLSTMSPRKNFTHLNHGLADALGVMGEWWSPLVVWTIDRGAHRFEEIQGSLQIARNILTDRLVTLVAAGVLERREYSAKPRRFEYHLTPAGSELIPILASLEAWGNQNIRGTKLTPEQSLVQ